MVVPGPVAGPAGTSKGRASSIPMWIGAPSNRTVTWSAEGTCHPMVTWAWLGYTVRQLNVLGALNWVMAGCPLGVDTTGGVVTRGTVRAVMDCTAGVGGEGS